MVFDTNWDLMDTTKLNEVISQMYKTIFYPFKSYHISLFPYNPHTARIAHVFHLLVCLLNVQLSSVSFPVHGITHCNANHLKISHHKQDTTWQCIKRWSTFLSDLLHIKHPLTYVILLFLKFLVVRSTPLLPSNWRITRYLASWDS